MKFKVGDWVKIINCDSRAFEEYIGLRFVIIDIDEKYNQYKIKVNDYRSLWWDEKGLELVNERPIEKPPLGVMPRRIYEMQRIQDLCRALYDYSKFDKFNIGLMKEWTCELIDRLYDIEDLFD